MRKQINTWTTDCIQYLKPQSLMVPGDFKTNNMIPWSMAEALQNSRMHSAVSSFPTTPLMKIGSKVPNFLHEAKFVFVCHDAPHGPLQRPYSARGARKQGIHHLHGWSWGTSFNRSTQTCPCWSDRTCSSCTTSNKRKSLISTTPAHRDWRWRRGKCIEIYSSTKMLFVIVSSLLVQSFLS